MNASGTVVRSSGIQLTPSGAFASGLGAGSVAYYDETIKHQRVVMSAANDDRHLIFNSWDGSGWTVQDDGLSPFVDVQVESGIDTTIETNLDTGLQRVSTFVIEKGYLYRRIHDQDAASQWIGDGKIPGIELMYGIGAVSYPYLPSGLVLTSESGPYINIFVVGVDGLLYMKHWDGARWTWTPQGGPPGTIAMLDNPVFRGCGGGVTVYADLATAEQRVAVFVTGKDKNLHVNYLSSSQWKWEKLGYPPTAEPNGCRVSAITYPSPAGQENLVFSNGTDGKLYMNSWDGVQSTWTTFGPPPTTMAADGPLAVTYIDPATGGRRIHVFVTGADGHIYVNKSDGASGTWDHLGAPAGTTVSTGVAVTTYANGTSQAIDVFAIGADGILYQNAGDGTNGAWSGHGRPANLGFLAGALSVVDASTTIRHVYVMAGGRGTDNHLYLFHGTSLAEAWSDLGPPPDASDFSGVEPVLFGKQSIYSFVVGQWGHLSASIMNPGSPGQRWLNLDIPV
jgi:hypothetical protein